MQFVMQPGMVYEYPLWGVALLLVGLAALGAVLFELTVHQFLFADRKAIEITNAARRQRMAQCLPSCLPYSLCLLGFCRAVNGYGCFSGKQISCRAGSRDARRLGRSLVRSLGMVSIALSQPNCRVVGRVS